MSTQQPYLLLKEDTQQVKGKDALAMNIEAIKIIAETIRSTLGPKGLNKMLVDSLGDITVTNDGAKILEELSIENPTAKLIVDLSKTIHKKTGDGASSAVLFIGELMDRVSDMLSMDISPRMIYDGYQKAIKYVKQELMKIALSISTDNLENEYQALVSSVLNSKSLGGAKAVFEDIIIQSAKKVEEKRGESSYVDIDNIQIVKKEGEGLESTELIEGIIIDKEIVSSSMVKSKKDAKIALLNAALEVVKTDFSSEIQISDPSEISGFLEQEEQIIQNFVKSIQQSGANVVFCQKGIDEMAQHYLAKSGIIAVRRVKNSDMQKLAKATGAKIISQVKDLKPSDLGTASLVSERKIGKDNMVFIEGCTNPKAVTILIRGGAETVVDEAERTIKNGLSVMKTVIEKPFYVGGGGSLEIELQKRLSRYAETIGGKEQIAIENFADALEIIPKALVENSGKDPLDIITSLKSQVDVEKKKWMGYDCLTSSIVNALEVGLLDSLQVKLQIYNLATELAVILIRIDDYIRAKGK